MREKRAIHPIQEFSLWILSATVALMTWTCGNAVDFAAQTGHRTTVPPPQSSPEVPIPASSVTWLWQCQPGGDPVQQLGAGEFKVHGGGDFHLAINPRKPLQLTFNGDFCPSQNMKRDIVFLIDVSGSMHDNDKGDSHLDPDLQSETTPTTCNRYVALKKTIEQFPTNGFIQFGVVTFDDAVDFKSSKLFSSENEFMEDVSPVNPAGDLCKWDGATNYTKALQGAGELLAKGRPDATKEIFFVTDGEPFGGDNEIVDGIDAAKALKGKGVTVGGNTIPVTIATFMLDNGDPKILKNDIASTDQDNKPLHVDVGQSQKLAETLAILAINKIMKARLKIRPSCEVPDDTCDHKWTVLDIPPPTKDLNFGLAPLQLDIGSYANGLEVSYEIWDRLSHKYENHGTLTW